MILMAIISMDNNETIKSLIKRIKEVDKSVAKNIEQVRKKGKYLPIIVMGSQDDLEQTFMVALNEALKREGIQDIMPETFYSHAIDAIEKWKKYYKDTYALFKEYLQKNKVTVTGFTNMLKKCDKKALDLFKTIYPELTSGSEFNPLVGGDVIPMYKSVVNSLREEHGYAGIYIIFDEFSKYIESQDKELAGNNMKVIQDLCELANDSDKSDMFFTLVAHKSIKEYGNHLSKEIINAYTGIEGRISEVYFVTSAKNSYELIQNAINCNADLVDKIPNGDKWFNSDTIINSHRIPAFSAFTYDDFERIVYKGCYPLTPVSAYALLNISEKVAQNERTLFTFISNDEPYSVRNFVNNHSNEQWHVSPDMIYDYFKNTFKKDTDNEYIHSEWINADYAIKKSKTDDQKKILKLIALINIINKPDEIQATEEIIKKNSMAIDSNRALEELIRDKIIYKKAATNCYTFKTKAGIELKKELKIRRKNSANIPDVFETISEMQYVLPKQYNYDYCMTRYFRSIYMDVTDFMNMNEFNVIFDNNLYQDGIIVYLYKTSNEISRDEIEEKVQSVEKHNIIFVLAKNTLKDSHIKSLINYEALLSIKNDIQFMRENEVLEDELGLMINDIKLDLLDFLRRSFGNNVNPLKIFFDGSKWTSDNNTRLERVVDKVCKEIYPNTMRINNELINKQFITTAPIKKARKTIISKLLNHESFDEYENGTSAEATIYRAVIKNTGIVDGTAESDIMDRFDEYIEHCVNNRQSISELITIYQNEEYGYGMRNGAFPILLAYELSKRSEDIVVYYREREDKLDEESIVNMSENPGEYSIFISKTDNEKEKYIAELAEMFDVKNELNLSGNRISKVITCMQRWYRALPQVTKNIKNTSESFDAEEFIKSLPKLREILQSYEINPYEVMFDRLPDLIGGGDFTYTKKQLQILKSKLDMHYNVLEKNVIHRTRKVFSDDEKDTLVYSLQNWYEKQSYNAKHGLQNSASTELMNYIKNISNHNEPKLVQDLSKIVIGTYIDVWNDDSFDEYVEKLESIKCEIESIGDEEDKQNSKLVFIDTEGKEVDSILYHSTEDGAVFRSILEDHLEDFEDLDVNTKVAVLIEMINKVTKRER